MKHGFWMVIGCALPLILILPALSAGETERTVVLLLAMALCCLMMFAGHGRRGGHGHAGPPKG